MRLLILAALLVAIGLWSQAFYVFDWGYGVLRSALIVGLLPLLLPAEALLRRTAPVSASRGLTLAAWALVAVGLAFHLQAAVRQIAVTHETGGIRLDQGQNVYRAIKLFPELNPYAREAMLDPVYYIAQLKKHYGGDCLTFSDPAPGPDATAAEQRRWIGGMLETVRRFWQRLELSQMSRLMPRVDPAPRCDGARFGFASLGFKYGPLTIAPYVPFVLGLDKPGVFVVQLLCFVGIFSVVLAWARLRSGGYGVLTALPLLVLVGTPHLLNNVLRTSALDAPPTLLALAGALLLARGGVRAGALCIGLALAAKPLPSLLYAPLALSWGRAPRAAAPFLVGAALLPYVPFALWDARGLLNNVVLYALTRDTDSTALAHFLPPAARPVLAVFAALALLAVLLAHHRQGFSPLRSARYLLIAHVCVLAAAGYLHNNYLTWLSPVLALYLFELGVVPQRGDERAAASGSVSRPGRPSSGAP